MCHFSPEFVHNVTLIAVHSPLQLCRQDIASLSILLCDMVSIYMVKNLEIVYVPYTFCAGG